MAVVFFLVLSAWDAGRSRAMRGEGVDWLLLSAVGVFIAAAVTDTLDGFLARRWNAVSPFGRIMDPFADKLLVLGAFVFLAGPQFAWTWPPTSPGLSAPGSRSDPGTLRALSPIEPWMVVVVLARELLVTSIRGLVESRGISFPATWSGKAKMILQSVCIPLVLVSMAWPWAGGEPVRWVGEPVAVVVWATVGVSAWSAIPYIARAVKMLSKEPDHGDGQTA